MSTQYLFKTDVFARSLIQCGYVILYNHNHGCALARVKGKYSSAHSWRSETLCSETMWQQSGPVMPDNGSVVNASCRCFFFSPSLFVFFKSQFFIQPKLL